MNNEILFKYKPISSVDQLARIIDSINNNQIFFPDYKKLNDPLESSGYVIELSGYMGKGLILAASFVTKIPVRSIPLTLSWSHLFAFSIFLVSIIGYLSLIS